MNTKPIKTFFESSVIIAGLASQSGASHRLLILAELGIIKPYISQTVVNEVLTNIQKKLPECVSQYYTLFKKLPFTLVDPHEQNLKYAQSVINRNDALILAAAIRGEVDWLVTLDRHFLDLSWEGKVKFKVGSPGEFIKKL